MCIRDRIADDLTMESGRIDLLGRMSTNTNWDTLGIIGSDHYYITNFVPESSFESPVISGSLINESIGVEEITGFEDGELEISAVLYDQAGNPVRFSVGSDANITIDETRPTIESISSINEDIAYNELDTIIIFAITSDDSLVLEIDLDSVNTYIDLNTNLIVLITICLEERLFLILA